MAAAEIAFHVFFRVASFLMGDDHAPIGPQLGQPARHGFVIRKQTVAVQLDPIGETPRNVIERERTLCMSRDLHALPGRQIIVNLAARGFDFRLHGRDLRIKIEVVLVGVLFQILQTPLQFENRFFEIERWRLHDKHVQALKR